jgi:hypothetical protein
VSNGNPKSAELDKWFKAGAPIAGRSDGGGVTFTLSLGDGDLVFRYRYGGRPREMTIGNYPDVSLLDARKRATAHRAMVDSGTTLPVKRAESGLRPARQ